MSPDAERLKADLINKAIARSRRRLGKNAQRRFAGFLRAYYANVPPRDIRDMTPETLFGLAHCHWKQGQTRPRRKPLIRVFNPDPKKDGWHSDHTVIEIINDDMPFLVDSVTAELNRQELTVLLIIHPLFKVRRNSAGKLLEVGKTGNAGQGNKAKDDWTTESFMHLQVTQVSGARLKEVEGRIRSVLRDVRRSVDDWSAMRGKMTAVIDELETAPKGV